MRVKIDMISRDGVEIEGVVLGSRASVERMVRALLAAAEQVWPLEEKDADGEGENSQ